MIDSDCGLRVHGRCSGTGVKPEQSWEAQFMGEDTLHYSQINTIQTLLNGPLADNQDPFLFLETEKTKLIFLPPLGTEHNKTDTGEQVNLLENTGLWTFKRDSSDKWKTIGGWY